MISEYQAFSQPAAIISIVVSLPVLVTVAMFPSMIKNKVFMEIILALVCCDIMGNWPYAMGYYPTTGSALCSFSGFCNLFFFRATWLYSLAIVINLRSIILHHRAILASYYLHIFALLLPLVLSLAILSTNKYGQPHLGNIVCSIYGNDQDELYWHNIAYSGLLLICVFFMLVIVAELKYLEVIKSPLVSADIYKSTLQTVIMYPLLLAICWLPHGIIGYVKLTVSNSTTDTLGPIFDVLKILHGALIAIGFYFTSREMRQRWRHLICGVNEAKDQKLVLATNSAVFVYTEDFSCDSNLAEIVRAQSSKFSVALSVNSSFSYSEENENSML